MPPCPTTFLLLCVCGGGGQRDALLIAASRCGLAREAAALWAWADLLPEPPNIYAYGALVDGAKRRRDLDGCRAALASLERRGVPASEVRCL